MKKILATILALTMVLSLGVSAFAANPGTEGGTDTGTTQVGTGDYSKELTVGLVANLPAPADSYSVEVKWDSLKFEYTGAVAASDWDPATHTYQEDPQNGSWSNGGNATITITNNSNVKVKANVSAYAGAYASGKDGVTVKCDGITNKVLEEGTESNVSTRGDSQVTCTVSVTGNPTTSMVDVNAGTITVTLAKNDA